MASTKCMTNSIEIQVKLKLAASCQHRSLGHNPLRQSLAFDFQSTAATTFYSAPVGFDCDSFIRTQISLFFSLLYYHS